MARKNTGLGRGLGALIQQKETGGTKTAVKAKPQPKATISSTVRKPSIAAAVAEPAVQGLPEISLDQIYENPDQPRTFFGHQELEELTDSVREHGIIQPLAVTPREGGGYLIIAGERRFRAAKMAGLKAVPAFVRETKDDERLMLALIENIQREDLNPIEEAVAYQRLTKDFDMTQDEVAVKVGKGRSTVANSIRLLTLPQEIQDAIADGKVPSGSARALISVSDPKKQMRMFRKLLSGGMTTRDVEAGARKSAGKARRDPELDGIEEQLREKYGTKVSVTRRQGRGRVTLEFFSDEEFESLIGSLLE